jgi:fermentation-respiration switch protein FrsA (DUF1100 family)
MTAEQAASARKPPTRASRRRWLRWLLTAGLVYLCVSVGIAMWQDKLIFPGAAMQGSADARVYASRALGEELVTLTTRRGDRVVALFGPALDEATGAVADDAASRPTVAFFYGNGTMLAYTIDYAREWRRAFRCNVIVPDYAGYGLSSGKPGEDAFYATADAVYDHLLTRKDIDAKQIVSAGWSIGSGVAIDLASRRPVIGTVVISPFTSLPAMGHKLFPWLPVDLLIRHKFRNDEKVPTLTKPLLVIHGEADSMIPVSMGRSLAASAKLPVTTLWVKGGEHNDIFAVGGDELIATWRAWQQSLPGTTTRP